MQRFAMFAIVFGGLFAVPVQVMAVPRWCVANHPDALFCEDWDRYCNAMVNDPVEACPAGSNNSEAYWLATKAWKSGTSGCSSLSVEDTWYTTVPFSGRANSSGDLGFSYMPLGPYVIQKYGPAYTQIMATDDDPIVVHYVMDGAIGKFNLFNMYMELTNELKQPLTDYIVSDNCTTLCGSTQESPFPIICRQSPTPSSGVGVCPPVATAPVLPSIAAGVVAFLDTNPCHCESATDHFPVANHLSFFDGKQWWKLNSSMFPGTFPGQGDFRLHTRTAVGQPGPNRVIMTIKATTVKVELYYVTTNNPAAEYSWCEIPRQYLGPFYIIKFGYEEPCRLKNGQWECATVRQCVNQKIGGTSTMDNIYVSGGIAYSAPGACCTIHNENTPPNISCAQANGPMDCDINYHGTFKGPGTACGQVPCCPTFLPDHDMDTDVDLEDFGWFQTCLSAAQFVAPPTIDCHCANLDGDADVDSNDFAIFAGCLSGPGIAANPGCMN